MAGIVHRKSSAKSDGADSSLVLPSDWNDTHTVAGLTRGDLIVGNSTPLLDRFAIGAAGTLLVSNGTDPAWSANFNLTGYGQLGSASAPSNTTAGDLTLGRLFSPTINLSPTNASGATGTITSTSHATKGHVYIGSSALFDFAEATGQLLIPTTGSGAGLVIGGDVALYRGAADVLYTPDSARIAGHGRIGSTSAPSNTTAGHLTVDTATFSPLIYGSITNASGGTLTISGSSAADGLVYVGSSSKFVFDEANTRFGIALAGAVPSIAMHIGSNVAAGTHNFPLRLTNLGSAATDRRVGLFLQNHPSLIFGAAMYSANDGVTGDGNLIVGNFSNGTFTARWTFWYDGGVTFGSPTGGDKGSGTLNAMAVYDENVLLTDHVFDAFLDGGLVVGNYEERLRPWVDRFQPEWLEPRRFAGFWRQNRRLPLMHDSLDSRGSVGEQLNALTLNAELLAIHLDRTLDRIDALEAARN